MKVAQNNPGTNVLRSGVSDEMVEQAIHSSGYPLQLVVAQQLSSEFSFQEEWSFVDPDSGSTRNIDLLTSKELFEWKEPQPRVRPELNLVIECKQSDLPYVFFLSGSQPWIPDYPVISGLKSKNIVLTSDDDPSSWSFRPLHVLGLERHPFLTESVPFCMTFSKCVRKGQNLTLSGSDAYQNLVFPILKAVSHFDHVQSPPSTAYYFDCHMVIGLAILDAPMVGVRLTGTGSETEILPWARVVRHQPCDDEHKAERSQILGFDVVHKDYLMTYITEHVMPFAGAFSELVLKHTHELADARGFVSAMGENSWTEIEPRLQRASFGTGSKRFGATIKRIKNAFKRSK